VRRVVALLEAADARVLDLVPSLKRYCGEVFVVAEK
jgi:hypothetical protein